MKLIKIPIKLQTSRSGGQEVGVWVNPERISHIRETVGDPGFCLLDIGEEELLVAMPADDLARLLARA